MIKPENIAAATEFRAHFPHAWGQRLLCSITIANLFAQTCFISYDEYLQFQNQDVTASLLLHKVGVCSHPQAFRIQKEDTSEDLAWLINKPHPIIKLSETRAVLGAIITVEVPHNRGHCLAVIPPQNIPQGLHQPVGYYLLCDTAKEERPIVFIDIDELRMRLSSYLKCGFGLSLQFVTKQ